MPATVKTPNMRNIELHKTSKEFSRIKITREREREKKSDCPLRTDSKYLYWQILFLGHK